MKRSLRGRSWIFGLSVSLVAFAAISCGFKLLQNRPSHRNLPSATVIRADLQSSIVVNGQVVAARKTIVECELQAYATQAGRTGGSATIIELVKDGAIVEKGDVLARLDSSEYEELARQGEILLLQGIADEEKARLDLKSAEVALKEYRDGLLPQLRLGYRGQIVLAESDIQRSQARLAWTRKMVGQGYRAQAQAEDEQAVLDRATTQLSLMRFSLDRLDRHVGPLQVKRLELAVSRCRGDLDFQSFRLQKRRDQLKRFQGHVTACIIRAPHAGMVIYASSYNPNVKVEVGATAYNRMNLFYLPDLGRMEVKIEVHESQIRRIQQGQPARVRINGAGDCFLDGEVKSLESMAFEPIRWWDSPEIRNFSAVIAVNSPMSGVLPGMSAEVQITGEARKGVLVVPTTAVQGDGGQDVVFVVGRDGLERRSVDVKPGDDRNLEVCSGLQEGERVILDPARIAP